LVSDYDCWIYKFDPDTTYFKIGIETKNYDALDRVWYDLYDTSNPKTDKIIKIGKTIKSYIDKDNDSYRESFAYETEIEGLKCIAVNKKSNSWIFGKKYDEYPIVMPWVFNGEKYIYSIFSSNPNVDCSKIAEKYGGGGHKGAAGFVSDELLFKKV
jgi:oligoribonuclease NrnB/cAMP/cGMP phosphodiesterase (DHH superfamily)